MHHTDHFSITFRKPKGYSQTYVLPEQYADQLEEHITTLLDSEDVDDDELISAEEAFPELNSPIQRPAIMLRGSRYRDNLTQKQLAEKLGIRQHHLSEMENAKRPIGKDMAHKLAKVFKTDYRVFL